MSIQIKPHAILADILPGEIEKLLNELGTGDIDSVPYDTAWIARLGQQLPGQGFDDALGWLRRHQYDDGSWGGQPFYHHDRFISTLAGMVALTVVGSSEDQRRIQKAENFLWHTYAHLHHDAHDTIGFPVLAVALINEARELGLDVPRDLYVDVATIEKKLNMIGHYSNQWRYNTMSFSLEAARPEYPESFDFLEDNGSVGTSPAATAAVMLQSGVVHPRSLEYLQQIVGGQRDGGAPNVAPIDTFEINWSLSHFIKAGAITPDHPEIQRMADFMWNAWSPDNGIGFSSFYSVPDLDDTTSAFVFLNWAGRDVNPSVFAHYETDTHFRCFPHETNPSMIANMRLLLCLRERPQHPSNEAWTEKILSTIRRKGLYGLLYFDKWHLSPYYLRATTIQALQGLDDELALPCVQWIRRTQNRDGGWGYYGESTAEETAYALMALLHWDKYAERIDPAQLDAGAQYLMQHIQDEQLPSLWIGKCLYTPRKVVRSTILAALYSYMAHQHA